MRHANGGTAVGNAPREFVDGLSLVKAGEALVVVWAVNGNVFLAEFLEGIHEFEEIFFAAYLAEVLGREIGVHTGTVPVASDWLAVPLDVNLVFLGEAEEKEASDPDIVGGFLGALGEDLEFPLTFGDFGIDAFVIDACIEAEVEVKVGDFASHASDVFEADTAVVFTLGVWVTAFGETERYTVLHEEILLLESEPGIGIICDGSAGVGRVGSAIRKHHLTHDEDAVFAGAVGVEGNRLEDAVGVAAFCLLGGGAIEAPLGKLVESRELIEITKHALGAEVLHGVVTVEPDVIESVFGHNICFSNGLSGLPLVFVAAGQFKADFVPTLVE